MDVWGLALVGVVPPSRLDHVMGVRSHASCPRCFWAVILGQWIRAGQRRIVGNFFGFFGGGGT